VLLSLFFFFDDDDDGDGNLYGILKMIGGKRWIYI
jgi:hypothetical protein